MTYASFSKTSKMLFSILLMTIPFFAISQNVGIGTTTPAQTLDVNGTTQTIGFLMPTGASAGKILKSDASGVASWSSIDAAGLFSTVPVVSDLSCPVMAGSIATLNRPASVAVAGNYAYVLNAFSNRMQVINISNPAVPVVVGLVVTGNYPISVALAGNYAFIVNNLGNTMQAINISNPAAPVVVGSVATGNTPSCIAVVGNYGYVTNYGSNTMQVINITNPATPVVAGSVATATNPFGVTAVGSYAYVTNFTSNTMQVINITNPAAPAVVGSFATGINPKSVAVVGNYAYVANALSNTLQVIDISNPAVPVLVGSVGTGDYPLSITVVGNYAFVVEQYSLKMSVYNISNPAAPFFVNSIGTGTDPLSVAIAGNYAYVVNYNSNTMQVINLACSQNFTLTYNPATGQTTSTQLQWNTSGTTISNSNNGNVGIGTTAPANKLTVSGNADFTGNVGIGTANPSSKLSVAGNVDITGTINVENFQTPAFLNSWVNYAAGFASAKYYKDKEGRVHLSGLVKAGTGGTIFTLPAGYRPSTSGTLIFTSVTSSGVNRVDIFPDGSVSSTIIGVGVWVSLSGISFRPD